MAYKKITAIRGTRKGLAFVPDPKGESIELHFQYESQEGTSGQSLILSDAEVAETIAQLKQIDDKPKLLNRKRAPATTTTNTGIPITTIEIDPEGEK